jgi:hypothetical protein
MAKLTIAMPDIESDLEIGNNPNRMEKRCICQMEVPGVGRLRTGERHPNFHLDARRESIKKQKSGEAELDEPPKKS